MYPRDKRDLDFKVQGIISQTEVWALINGKEYIYCIDGAKLPKFRSLYGRSPGRALNYLKKHSYHTEKQ